MNYKEYRKGSLVPSLPCQHAKKKVGRGDWERGCRKGIKGVHISFQLVHILLNMD